MKNLLQEIDKLFKEKRYLDALSILNSLTNKIKKSNDNNILKFYDLKAKIYEETKNYKKAYYARLEYKKTIENIYKKEKLKIIQESKRKTESLLKELKNEQLELEYIKLKNKKELQDKELTYKALQIVQKNKLIVNIKDLLKEFQSQNPDNIKIVKEVMKKIESADTSKAMWNEFEKWFTEVNKNFFENLNKILPKLGKRYRQLASLIKLGLRSKDIALIMGITSESVDKYRMRFRKKLELSRSEKLSEYLNKL